MVVQAKRRFSRIDGDAHGAPQIQRSEFVEKRVRDASRAIVMLFFFFQAEDGIRDLTVTGVQTCALPICGGGGGRRGRRLSGRGARHGDRGGGGRRRGGSRRRAGRGRRRRSGGTECKIGRASCRGRV